MIHRSLKTLQIKNWQQSLQSLITSPETLIERLKLDNQWLTPAQKAAKLFPLRVTESYLSKIKPGDPYDPLLLQILPLHAEHEIHPQFEKDPLSEKQFNPCPGVVHKYHSRVLFIASTQCAINCRYCFRRHFPYQENRLNKSQWEQAVNYVAQRPHVNEVILSGGDPLTLSDKQLSWLVDLIAQIPHVDTLRIHSRFPVVLPERFTEECLQAIQHKNLHTVFVAHINHAQEIDEHASHALNQLSSQGITLLNQSVLLKGINDSTSALVTLNKTLFKNNTLPYYLHLLDQVEGTAHFQVNTEDAKRLYHSLLAALPGYLVPKLVKEEPNALSKTPIPV